MEYGFTGDLGVDGLDVALSRAESKGKNAVDTVDGDESTMFGVAYNFGQFAVGYSQNDMTIQLVRGYIDSRRSKLHFTV